jgi:hypothetical protein
MDMSVYRVFLAEENPNDSYLEIYVTRKDPKQRTRKRLVLIRFGFPVAACSSSLDRLHLYMQPCLH